MKYAAITVAILATAAFPAHFLLSAFSRPAETRNAWLAPTHEKRRRQRLYGGLVMFGFGAAGAALSYLLLAPLPSDVRTAVAGVVGFYAALALPAWIVRRI